VTVHLVHGRRIVLTRGDITQQKADAIVNAANSALAPGGGVCGAIHRAGGPGIAQECAAIVAKCGEVPVGGVVPTTAGDLPARYVFHAVGPRWQGGRHAEAEALASCYRESMALAEKLQLLTIAFPSISTGIFGYPLEAAAAVALSAVAEALESARSIEEVRWVLFDEATEHAYEREATVLADHVRRAG